MPGIFRISLICAGLLTSAVASVAQTAGTPYGTAKFETYKDIWRAGAGYQPGKGNFAAIQAWNAASVYQRAIALMGRQIDGG